MTSRLTLHIFSSFQRTLKFEVSSPFWKTLKKTLDTHIFQAFFHLSTLNFSTFQFLFLLLWFLVLLLSSMLLQCWCYCCWHGCYWVVGVFVNIVVVVVTVFFADVVTLATDLSLLLFCCCLASQKNRLIGFWCIRSICSICVTIFLLAGVVGVGVPITIAPSSEINNWSLLLYYINEDKLVSLITFGNFHDITPTEFSHPSSVNV